jgi:hypothetical protein
LDGKRRKARTWGLQQFISRVQRPLNNDEQGDELSFVSAYKDLTGANEFAARAVFMYRGCQENKEMHPDYADDYEPHSEEQSSNYSTPYFGMRLAS